MISIVYLAQSTRVFTVALALVQAILDLEPSTMIEYKHFSTSMEDMSTYRHAKPYVFAAAQAAN
jgi:hypothetical protein